MKHGTKEWSDASYNIQTGCEHGCVYCYAKSMQVGRFGRITDWTKPVIRQKDVDKGWRHTDKLYMFPTSHDITPGNLDAYIHVLRKMLTAGIRVLCVSKPHVECIQAICDAAEPFKHLLSFRFSIGSCDDRTLSLFEPFAPTFNERISALELAFERGFSTSISAEPLLGGMEEVEDIERLCLPFVSETVWVGKLNNINTWKTIDTAAVCERIQTEQTDANIMELVSAYHGKPWIRWKDSIKKVNMAISAHLKTYFRGTYNASVENCIRCDAELDYLQKDCLGIAEIPPEQNTSVDPNAVISACPQCGKVQWCHAGGTSVVVYAGYVKSKEVNPSM